ncbi:MAG TPA: WD40 repeat domain-containing protein [Opitutaceae bacterium]|nr:WD40 repeat domain-containing protein [Opitutaceae bacterium]
MNLTKHWAATLDDYVIDLAWSPDGEILAAASAAGPVTLFATADGAKRHELPGHENGTNAVAWRPEARGLRPEGSTASSPTPHASSLLLATGGQDGAVKFWDAAAGQQVTTAKLGSAWVEHLAWNPTPSAAGLLFAAAGRDLFALGADGSIRHRFKPAPKTITALAWWGEQSDRGQVTGAKNSDPASALRSPASGGTAAVAYFGGVCLWDGADFGARKEFAYNNGIHALVWSPDGKWLVSGNQDPSVHLWIPAEDAELHMSGYEGKVKHLSFDHTSRWLATGGGHAACLWDCSGAGPEGREPGMLPHEAPVCGLAFQHAHGLLATASQDGVVMLWSPERKQPLRATVRMPAAATRLAWSPDDRYLAIGSEKGAVYVLKAD